MYRLRTRLQTAGSRAECTWSESSEVGGAAEFNVVNIG